MRVLVTGAAGMLGLDVIGAASARGHEVIALARAELDITDAQATQDAFERARPDVAVNCAAWTDVDGAEEHEDAATAVNGQGAGNVTRAATATGAHLVHVSTDYVFDGAATRPYVESDATAPQSAYGRSKLAGEHAVGAEHTIARAAWLFGAGGRNFVRTMLALGAERDAVSVVTDQVGCPTFTGHLAPALLELAEQRATGIHHVAPPDHCSWHDFAVAIFEAAGVECAVNATTSAEFRRPAPRPAWSVLGSERADAVLLPSWREGLDAYLHAVAVV